MHRKTFSRVLVLLLLLCCAPRARSQGGFTTVTGTVTDPNGVKWACGTISAQLITAGGPAPTLNGGGFTTQTSPVSLGCPTTPGTGPSGSFAMRLADSGVIVPSNTTWRFTVNTSGNAPPLGTGPQTFSFITAINCSTNTPSTCTSNQLDISTQLSALAPALGNASGGVSSVSTLPAVPCTNGTVVSLINVQVFSCINGIWVPDGGSITPAVVTDALNFGVLANNGQACFDGNVTVGSPTVTTTQALCHFNCPGGIYPCSVAGTGSDVGKHIFATQICQSSATCGPYQFNSSAELLGATQVANVTVLSIQSATSLTASANANASCSPANLCAVVILADETANLNAAWNASQAASAPGCPRLQLPAGLLGYSDLLFQGTSGQPCNGASTGGPNLQQLGIVGPTIVGTGQLTTILVPLPNFNYAHACAAGNAMVGNGKGLALIDLAITGFGQSGVGAGITATCPRQVQAEYVHNVNLTGWGSRIVGTTGITFASFSSMDDSYLSGFGFQGISAGSFTTLVNNSISSPICLLSSGSPVSSSDNNYYGPGFNGFSCIDVTTGTLVSLGDTQQSINSNPSAPTASVRVRTGGTLISSNYVQAYGTANTIGLQIDAGGTAQVFGWKSLSANGAGGLSNAGTFTDSCANNFNGATSGAGTFFGSCSATGTVITSAKLVLSAGWGASAAWTALSGNTQLIQGTITNTGAGQAANPTITYTFPTAFFGVPVCSAYQVGGTQTILAATEFLTPSAVTATGATFTYNGTPTVNLTEQVQILCGLP